MHTSFNLYSMIQKGFSVFKMVWSSDSAPLDVHLPWFCTTKIHGHPAITWNGLETSTRKAKSSETGQDKGVLQNPKFADFGKSLYSSLKGTYSIGSVLSQESSVWQALSDISVHRADDVIWVFPKQTAAVWQKWFKHLSFKGTGITLLYNFALVDVMPIFYTQNKSQHKHLA